MPNVSVIIPVYNRAKYVAEAIESVLNQSSKCYELIVVDDGSTDESAVIIKQYQSQLTYVYQSNQGVSAARNHGFQKAAGDYVLFLDSDDSLLPNALADLMNMIERSPEVDIVFGDAYFTDQGGQTIGRVSDYLPQLNAESPFESLVLYNSLHICAAVVRHDCLISLTGPFDEDMYGGEDWDLWIRLAAQGCRFKPIDVMVATYRMHPGNKSSPASGARERRQASLIHSRMKVLGNPYFSSLSAITRYEFFYNLLIGFSVGNHELQLEALRSEGFTSLPKSSQTSLLRQLGIATVLIDDLSMGRKLIKLSIQKRPSDLKSLLAFSLSTFGRFPLILILNLFGFLRKSQGKIIRQSFVDQVFPFVSTDNPLTSKNTEV